MMPISCFAVAFSMRSRLPAIIVPFIAASAASASSAAEKETKPKPCEVAPRSRGRRAEKRGGRAGPGVGRAARGVRAPC